MLGGESVACRFVLEKVVSGVEGVWVDGMGAAEMELGGVSLLIDVADVDDASFLEPEKSEGQACDV
jgi:hypothetical protein